MQDKSKSPLSGRSGLRKQPRLNNKILLVIFILSASILFIVFILTGYFSKAKQTATNQSKSKLDSIIKSSSTPSPTITPSPTPKPLTFSEMNTLYGPCVRLPVLMYHRIQTEESAKEENQTSISVFTNYFEEQMQYLKDKGYNVASMNDLVNFFDNGTKIPAKSVLITFDDGYEDFFTDAYPILQKFNYPATVFVSTGLVNNSGYLSWDQIISMKDKTLFANHTWSHKNVQVGSAMEYEISTADTQLSEHGQNSPKIFAYPYGIGTKESGKYLASLNYKLAFTTASGSILCEKQRMSLPRVRVGNIHLSSYGF